MIALKRRTVASAPRCASHSRFIRAIGRVFHRCVRCSPCRQTTTLWSRGGQATNNDGRSCRGSHSNSWDSHRSSHSHRNSHRSSHDGRLADNSKPFVAQARERVRLCFRLLALPRHRRSRQVQCQPQRVPPECIVSFLHTRGELLTITSLRGTALMQIERPAVLIYRKPPCRRV